MSNRAALPWSDGTRPLMLAPMQGLTNRALRAEFAAWVCPDVLFTEFVRVHGASVKRRVSAADRREIAATEGGIPLVTQLIGHGVDALTAAAREAQAAGAVHINFNMGCPYGRTTSGLTGGNMLRRPDLLCDLLPALRAAVAGGFSVKLRAGYDDPRQIFSLLPLFEKSEVDFLILHPRTVKQEYAGEADHALTAEVVRATTLPVIANGDIRSAEGGLRVLGATGAAGLMLGRGAIADPLLFERLRGRASATPSRSERSAMLRRYLRGLHGRYRELFCGDTQVLAKLKAVLCAMDDPDFTMAVRDLKRAATLPRFLALVERLG
ncbi:tRNA dihydrouridine synthase [Trichloromonas sp.]|uniref:tRNA dihydrouridine synthase n=1 Tax=Trichloromonas sp. TaxID=3069249 RepID=UPI002A4DD7B7|nr:tRNA-dihydrouridine synthase family protein [Trichloromonas sp.]